MTVYRLLEELSFAEFINWQKYYAQRNSKESQDPTKTNLIDQDWGDKSPDEIATMFKLS